MIVPLWAVTGAFFKNTCARAVDSRRWVHMLCFCIWGIRFLGNSQWGHYRIYLFCTARYSRGGCQGRACVGGGFWDCRRWVHMLCFCIWWVRFLIISQWGHYRILFVCTARDKRGTDEGVATPGYALDEVLGNPAVGFTCCVSV